MYIIDENINLNLAVDLKEKATKNNNKGNNIRNFNRAYVSAESWRVVCKTS